MDDSINYFWPLEAATLLGSQMVHLGKRANRTLGASKRAASRKSPTPSVQAIRLLEGVRGDTTVTRFVCFGVDRSTQVKTAALLLTQVDLPRHLRIRATRALCLLMMSQEFTMDANCKSAMEGALQTLNCADVISSEMIMTRHNMRHRERSHLNPSQLSPVLKSLYGDTVYHNWQRLTQHLLPI